MKAERQRPTIGLLKILEREKRYFRYHRRRIQLDQLGDHVCNKIQNYFWNETSYLTQAIWMYHSANKMFIKTLELAKYDWRSRDRIIHARELLALKGFMLKDLISWEKSG